MLDSRGESNVTVFYGTFQRPKGCTVKAQSSFARETVHPANSRAAPAGACPQAWGRKKDTQSSQPCDTKGGEEEVEDDSVVQKVIMELDEDAGEIAVPVEEENATVACLPSGSSMDATPQSRGAKRR